MLHGKHTYRFILKGKSLSFHSLTLSILATMKSWKPNQPNSSGGDG
jgi:hypothetical protein